MRVGRCGAQAHELNPNGYRGRSYSSTFGFGLKFKFKFKFKFDITFKFKIQFNIKFKLKFKLKLKLKRNFQGVTKRLGILLDICISNAELTRRQSPTSIFEVQRSPTVKLPDVSIREAYVTYQTLGSHVVEVLREEAACLVIGIALFSFERGYMRAAFTRFSWPRVQR